MAGATFDKVNEYTDKEKVLLDAKVIEAPVSEVTESFTLDVESEYGSTITWTSNNGAIVITGASAQVTQGDEDVKVVLTAKISSNEESKELIFNITVKKTGGTAAVQQTATIKYTGSTTGNMTGDNDADQVGLDKSVFTVTSSKGSQSNHIGLNKAGYLAIYSDKASGDGATLTISVDSGYVIEKVVITFGAGKNGTATFTVNGVDSTTATTEYIIDSQSVEIKNTSSGGDKAPQLWITSIVITYKQVA